MSDNNAPESRFSPSLRQLAWERGADVALAISKQYLQNLAGKITAEIYLKYPVPMEYYSKPELYLAYTEGVKEMILQEISDFKKDI